MEALKSWHVCSHQQLPCVSRDHQILVRNTRRLVEVQYDLDGEFCGRFKTENVAADSVWREKRSIPRADNDDIPVRAIKLHSESGKDARTGVCETTVLSSFPEHGESGQRICLDGFLCRVPKAVSPATLGGVVRVLSGDRERRLRQVWNATTEHC